MLARLGSEAADAIDEFLTMALDFETREIPTLRGFIAHMRAAELNVKRDMELGRNEVRVMTVHGAKGLEADIVFLADTMGKPGSHHDPKIFAIAPPNAPAETPPRLVWSPSAKADIDIVAAARQQSREAQAEEYRRLLYVAMTRAADRLIVCGAQPKRRDPDVWYEIIARAIGPEAVEEEADDGKGPVRRWRKGPAAPSISRPAGVTATLSPALPGWLSRPAPAATPRARVLTPSSAIKEERIALAGTPASLARREAALRRGTLIHRLLQSLPDLPDDRRAEAAARFLAAQGDIDGETRAGLATEALRLMADARIAPLFGPGSRAEVPLAGRLAGRPVSGQIDRLLIAPDRIVIADFKTNDPAPTAVSGVPDAYVAQLAIYRALIAGIVPDRPVEAWLVWTAVPDIMAIPPERLDAMLATLGVAP
jgi:ATP-dependent helicase/nuclease subunit A